jgi:hypothetical protein
MAFACLAIVWPVVLLLKGRLVRERCGLYIWARNMIFATPFSLSLHLQLSIMSCSIVGSYMTLYGIHTSCRQLIHICIRGGNSTLTSPRPSLCFRFAPPLFSPPIQAVDYFVGSDFDDIYSNVMKRMLSNDFAQSYSGHYFGSDFNGCTNLNHSG